jgi:TolB-like protein/class 3 adenylate cyclase
MERKLTTIMIADVAGYGRLSQIDEEGTRARFRADLHEVFEPKLTTHHGRLVKTMGDGLLIEFRSVVDAVRCAIEVQRAKAERNVGLLTERRLTFRIAINLGDVIVEDDDIHGDGVNIADRLQGLADPGGITISGTAYDQVKGKLAVGYADLGQQRVKNMTEPVRVYKVLMDPVTAGKVLDESRTVASSRRWLATAAAAAAVLAIFAGATTWWRPWEPRIEPASVERMALPLPDKPSIAVLPFTNMSGDPEQEYFADGMTDDLITDLSKSSALFVIARNSTFVYKGKPVNISQVAEELGVRYVLEGSVRRAGHRLRFTGQLVDTASGSHIWADRFDGEMSDVFDLQDRMSESVVGAIEPKLQLAEIERVKHKPAANLDAYDLLLRAQQFEYEFTEQSLAAALRCLEQALAIDPCYAPALGLAAYCYVERRVQWWAQNLEAEAIEGLRLAMRAIELAREDANVLWMAAYAGRSFGMEQDRARELLDRSLRLNPNSAMALTIAAWNQTFQNPVAALELLRRAERLSPRDPRAWVMDATRAFAYFVGGQFEDAAAAAKKGLAQNPRSARALRLLAASLARLGQLDNAAAAIQELLAIDPHITISRVRQRLRHWPESVWNSYSEGLRLAGLPE